MKTITTTIAAILLAGAAHAGGNSNGPVRVQTELDVYNRLTAMGFSSADARAEASNYAAQHLANTNKNTNVSHGGDARSTATGGNAHQGQLQGQGQVQGNSNTVGGQRNSQTTVINEARAAASSAIAPNVIVSDGNACYWTFSIAGAAQTTSGGGSAGAGLFPVRLETCFMLELADRHAANYCADPSSDACRLLRRVEASFQ